MRSTNGSHVTRLLRAQAEHGAVLCRQIRLLPPRASRARRPVAATGSARLDPRAGRSAIEEERRRADPSRIREIAQERHDVLDLVGVEEAEAFVDVGRDSPAASSARLERRWLSRERNRMATSPGRTRRSSRCACRERRRVATSRAISSATELGASLGSRMRRSRQRPASRRGLHALERGKRSLLAVFKRAAAVRRLLDAAKTSLTNASSSGRRGSCVRIARRTFPAGRRPAMSAAASSSTPTSASRNP